MQGLQEQSTQERHVVVLPRMWCLAVPHWSARRLLYIVTEFLTVCSRRTPVTLFKDYLSEVPCNGSSCSDGYI